MVLYGVGGVDAHIKRDEYLNPKFIPERWKVIEYRKVFYAYVNVGLCNVPSYAT